MAAAIHRLVDNIGGLSPKRIAANSVTRIPIEKHQEDCDPRKVCA
jgi:hypothetical protein